MPAKRLRTSTQGKSGATAEKKVEKKSEPSAMDTQSVDELIDYMQTEYGFKMNERLLEKGDFEAVREQVSALEEIFQEFPGARDAFGGIAFVDSKAMSRSNSYAEAEMYGSGMIRLNTKYFSSRPLIENTYSDDVKYRFHPSGTTSKHITSHEAGHILERALVRKYLPGVQNSGARVDAFNSRKYANKVVDMAVRSIGKSLGMSKPSLRKQVSQYAMKNASETLAECVADYMANKSKARPLSKEVYKILKQELG